MNLFRHVSLKHLLTAQLFILALPFTSQAQDVIRVEQALASVPSAPPGLTVPPLPSAPLLFETGEGFNIKVEVVTQGLFHPWGFVSLPDNTILITERNSGLLRIIRNDQLNPEPVSGLPEIRAQGYSGLYDIVLHPDFENNQLIYLSYNKPMDADSTVSAIVRATWDGDSLQNAEDIYVGDSAGVASLVFDAEGFLYMSLYGSSDDAQDLSDLRGKTIRLTDAGAIPADNPFVSTPGAYPEIYTLGHRTTQGMELNPQTGEIWSLEMGPNGGDEVNVLTYGGNYGWPVVSLGRDYAGPWQSVKFQEEGFENPVAYWTPSISVSGMTFYTGDKLPGWQNDLFIGGMRMGELQGTGHLQRIRFNGNGEEIRREMLLVSLRQRIRGAFQGTDGYLYVLTDADDGALLRIGPE